MHRILFVLQILFFTTPLAWTASATDSERVMTVLSDAKLGASTLKRDAAELNSFAQSGISWQSYAGKLNEIKTDVNQIAGTVRELNNLRIVASPWQRVAIDRVSPLLEELADSTNGIIIKLNNNANRVHMPPYKEYVSAHYELASNLAAIIGDFVEYGRTKAKFEMLVQKLELPEQ